uniref:Glycosyl transferase n=1 Tax=Macrostomum lignano TaxID=282301 RepID=A0A1I8HQ23_9PLAT
METGFKRRNLKILGSLLIAAVVGTLLSGVLKQCTSSNCTVKRSQVLGNKAMSKAQSVLKNVSSVPKILHQVFASERVYANYLPFVNSCLSRNPDWQYYLWTDKTAEKLIVDRYPEFLAKYKQYTDNLEKADSIRYIVLHHMGGIYLDMDVECIRPFFPALEGIQAFLDQERPEQTNIGLAQRYSAMNSAMGARPGHPFFRHVIDQLQAGTRVGEALRTTGPLALTSALESYRRVGAAAGVKLLDPKVFSPLMVDMNKWKKRCRGLLLSAKWSSSSRWSLQQRGCVQLQAKGWRADDSNGSTIGLHRFLHLGYDWIAGKQRLPPISLTKAFPGRVKFYGGSA